MLKPVLKTLFSIVVVVAVLVGAVAGWRSLPVLRQMSVCYQEAVARFDRDGFESRARGWSQRQICDNSQDTIINLDACLQKINQNEVSEMINPTVWNVLKIIRPGTKDIDTYKTEHNAVCVDYPSTLF